MMRALKDYNEMVWRPSWEMAEEALERIFCAAGDFDDCSVPLVLLERHHGVHQE